MDKIPNCSTCGCCAIENMANNKKFYYCTECKEEVQSNTFVGSPPIRSYRDADFQLTKEEEEAVEKWFDMEYGDAD